MFARLILPVFLAVIALTSGTAVPTAAQEAQGPALFADPLLSEDSATAHTAMLSVMVTAEAHCDLILGSTLLRLQGANDGDRGRIRFGPERGVAPVLADVLEDCAPGAEPVPVEYVVSGLNQLGTYTGTLFLLDPISRTRVAETQLEVRREGGGFQPLVAGDGVDPQKQRIDLTAVGNEDADYDITMSLPAEAGTRLVELEVRSYAATRSADQEPAAESAATASDAPVFVRPSSVTLLPGAPRNLLLFARGRKDFTGHLVVSDASDGTGQGATAYVPLRIEREPAVWLGLFWLRLTEAFGVIFVILGIGISIFLNDVVPNKIKKNKMLDSLDDVRRTADRHGVAGSMLMLRLDASEFELRQQIRHLPPYTPIPESAIETLRERLNELHNSAEAVRRIGVLRERMSKKGGWSDWQKDHAEEKLQQAEDRLLEGEVKKAHSLIDAAEEPGDPDEEAERVLRTRAQEAVKSADGALQALHAHQNPLAVAGRDLLHAAVKELRGKLVAMMPVDEDTDEKLERDAMLECYRLTRRLEHAARFVEGVTSMRRWQAPPGDLLQTEEAYADLMRKAQPYGDLEILRKLVESELTEKKLLDLLKDGEDVGEVCVTPSRPEYNQLATYEFRFKKGTLRDIPPLGLLSYDWKFSRSPQPIAGGYRHAYHFKPRRPWQRSFWGWDTPLAPFTSEFWTRLFRPAQDEATVEVTLDRSIVGSDYGREPRPFKKPVFVFRPAAGQRVSRNLEFTRFFLTTLVAVTAYFGTAEVADFEWTGVASALTALLLGFSFNEFKTKMTTH